MQCNITSCNAILLQVDILISKNWVLTMLRIVGKFGREKVWRIDSFRVFGERKFGELIHQPISYQL